MSELAEIDAAFNDALEHDAGGTPDTGPAVAAPPRKSDNPDAPHGIGPDGAPLAPYGHKADGRPRIKPGGPGRRSGAQDGDDRPRVAVVRPAAAAPGPVPVGPGPAAAGPDYSEQLAELGTAIWLGASSMRGGRLWFLKVPDTRPYAAIWMQQLPGLVGAWNAAAKQNAKVRGYVEQLSGEGSKAWMIGVAVTAAGLTTACVEMARATPQIRAAAAAKNDTQLEKFIGSQLAELGLEEAAAPAAAVSGQAAA